MPQISVGAWCIDHAGGLTRYIEPSVRKRIRFIPLTAIYLAQSPTSWKIPARTSRAEWVPDSLSHARCRQSLM